MIIVCEPQCKRISHEQVNSGFIYGLRLAYPQEKIIFFADTTHFEAIKNILKKDRIHIDNFEHVPINFNANKSCGVGGIISYYLLFKKIFKETISLKTNKIFFLSNNPIILFAVKKLRQQSKFKDISCTFVLHGELEDIANTDYKESYIPTIKDGTSKSDLVDKVIKAIKHPGKILPYIFNKIYGKYSLIFKRIFRVKKIMMWRHSDHYKYIALSPHIVKNAKEHIDTDYLNFHTVIMPIIFTEPLPPANNQFIKFAVFGYGDSAQMHEMLLLLNKKVTSKPYEIRIISMDQRGTYEFPNISYVGKDGVVLQRTEMEEALPDIDMFINLHGPNRHKFGCSLSIFEAFAYLKPVLYLNNDGYNQFNRPEKPIGFCCQNMAEYVAKMSDLIENYPLYKKELSVFRKNMLSCRNEYTIENNLSKLRESFTYVK